MRVSKSRLFLHFKLFDIHRIISALKLEFGQYHFHFPFWQGPFKDASGAQKFIYQSIHKRPLPVRNKSTGVSSSFEKNAMLPDHELNLILAKIFVWLLLVHSGMMTILGFFIAIFLASKVGKKYTVQMFSPS